MNESPAVSIPRYPWRMFPLAAAILLLGNVSAAQESSRKKAAALRGTWGYVLQAEKLAPTRAQAVELLAASGRDVLVLDPFYEPGRRWQAEELRRIGRGKPGRVLLAYLSIGEAEDYRPYWRSGWKKHPPQFLGAENPHWPGNYAVRFWHPQWQRIILQEVDRVLAQGFDGLYLDKVDAFEHYEYDPSSGRWIDNRRNTATGQSYRADMIAWVRLVAARARRRRASALVVPQNGEQLLLAPRYRRTIDAQAVEDLFCDGDRPQKASATDYRLGFLRLLSREGKPVVCVEYCRSKAQRELAIRKARQRGFSLLLAPRQLDRLGEAFSW